MTVTAVRILNALATEVAATIDGREWSGIYCHVENGVIVIDGNGQIPDAVKAWIAEGNTPTLYEAPALVSVQASAMTQIDMQAEAMRLRYITAGSGQAMTYNEKLAEARLILVSQATQDAANAMDTATLQATYPMIAACIGIDGATASAVATTVQASWAAWAQIGGKIEKKRRDAKAAIGAATTVEAVTAAANVDWTIA